MVILERINKKLLLLISQMQQNQFLVGDQVVLSEYLDPANVLFIDEMDRDLAIKRLVNHLCDKKHIKDPEVFYEAVIQREKIVSTGVGKGVAIPHAKLDTLSDFFIAIGIHKTTGIEWQSLDGSLVRLIFLIGGPAEDQKKYLKILSNLTSLIKEDRFQEALFMYKDPEEIIKIFRNYDRSIS